MYTAGADKTKELFQFLWQINHTYNRIIEISRDHHHHETSEWTIFNTLHLYTIFINGILVKMRFSFDVSYYSRISYRPQL